jgi:para-aminobenzoate synthetase/4-amino-4-deoxychorismate lyase
VAHPFSPDRAMGVFETILVVGGLPVELDAHMQRLRRSVEELFGASPPKGAREAAVKRAAALTLGRLRLTVFAGDRGTLDCEAVGGPIAREEVFPAWGRAVDLQSFELPGGLGAHKWADRALLTRMQARDTGRIPLLLDAGGEVLEASRANVFAVDGEVLITPPADGRILAGVARARVIAIARALGVELREEALHLERLLAAGAAFLTGSLRGVEPVRSVAEAGLAPPGPAVDRIASQLSRAWLGRPCSEPAARGPDARSGAAASC